MVLKKEQPTTSADSQAVKKTPFMFVHDRVLMSLSLYTPQQQCKGSTAMFP